MHRCCTDGDRAATILPSTPRSSLRPAGARRVRGLLQWALPLTTLALIPKCPMCLAAYVLFFTGVGLSLPAAAAARWTLIALSLAGLGYLVVRLARRALAPTA